MSALDRLTALSIEHEELSRLSARHQEALVTRARARAAHVLSLCLKCLHYHIGLEERYLPSCAEKNPGQWQAHAGQSTNIDSFVRDHSNDSLGAGT